MATVTERITIKAPADKVWADLGDFDGLHRWHPAFAKSTAEKKGGDRLRHLTLQDGAKLVERLVKSDPKARTYTYAIIDPGPLPIARYQATVSAKDSADKKSVTLEWRGDFEPKGAPAAEVQALIAGVYKAGFDALAKKFGKP
jgi:Polyketide cyclase / dehydrase and lipid transport